MIMSATSTKKKNRKYTQTYDDSTRNLCIFFIEFIYIFARSYIVVSAVIFDGWLCLCRRVEKFSNFFFWIFGTFRSALKCAKILQPKNLFIL